MRKESFIITNPFDKCLKVFIFFLPIIWLPNFTQSSLQLLLFNYGALILFGLSITLPREREFSNYNILLLIIFSAFLCLVRTPKSLPLSFLNIIFGCLLYYSIVSSVKDIEGVSKIFLWVMLVNIIVMIFQTLGFQLIYSPNQYGWIEYGGSPMCGFMAHKNHLAMFIALCSPLLLRRSLYFILLVFIILSITTCYSVMFACLVGFGILAYFKIKSKKTKIIIGASITLFMLILSGMVLRLYPYKIASRLPQWGVILKESFINPFLGYGFNSFDRFVEAMSLNLSNLLMANTYNEYIWLFFEFGIIPILVLGYFAFRYYKKIFGRNELSQALLASVMSFLVIMGFQNPLHIPRVGVPMLITLALFEVSCLNRKEIKC